MENRNNAKGHAQWNLECKDTRTPLSEKIKKDNHKTMNSSWYRLVKP